MAVAQGARVLKGNDCVWVEKRRFFFESIPPHRRVRLQGGDAARIFFHGAAVIRYTTDEEEGAPSFEYVCDDRKFDLGSIAPEARRRVRQGLQAFDIRRIEFGLLEKDGCAINRSVYARQGRMVDSFLTRSDRWARYMKACAASSIVEAYGAFLDNRLCGFSIAAFVDDYCYLQHTHAYTEFMKQGPIYALTFAVTKAALERPGVNYVSQGLESFQALPNVDRFKFSMGFRKRPVQRRILINPLARPLFSSSGAWITRNILRYMKPGLLADFATFTRAIRGDRLKSGFMASPVAGPSEQMDEGQVEKLESLETSARAGIGHEGFHG
ncbi:MAG: hypothetical protein WB780_02440 [Candidatus Acidiferrales bacterium]